MDLILLLVLLLLSGLFSGSETAFFSLRPADLLELGSRHGRAGRRVVALLDDSHAFLSALLIGNLLVNTAASVVATALCLSWFGSHGLVVAVPSVTVLLLLFGEITPKLAALRFRRSLALLTQAPLSLWVWLIRPLLRLIAALTAWMVRLFPGEPTGSLPLGAEELETACDLAVEQGSLTETEGRFLARLLNLHAAEVRQIMTPRPDVETLDRSWPRERILEAVRAAGFNRYPVTSADSDQPVGLIHLRDLQERRDAERPLAGDLRPLEFVPESKDVAALLHEMRTGGVHLVAVVDEHGDFTGIASLADCLRALIGAVGDEGGRNAGGIQRAGAGSWLVAGRCDLREIQEICGVTLTESRDYVTVAGYLMSRLGRIPDTGDRLLSEDVRLTVVEIEGHKVVSLLLERVWDEQGEGDG